MLSGKLGVVDCNKSMGSEDWLDFCGDDELDDLHRVGSFAPKRDEVTSAALTSKTFFSVDVAAIRSANEPGNTKLLSFFVLLVY